MDVPGARNLGMGCSREALVEGRRVEGHVAGKMNVTGTMQKVSVGELGVTSNV
jgi:hypothetical protein